MPPLLIAGFSARAAAQSAKRAGFEVYAADAFGDRDLRATATQLEVVNNYPDELPAACARLPAAPWMYTGGLENEPAVVGEIPADRQLLGNGSEVLSLVRNPFLLEEKLLSNRLQTPVPVAMPEMRRDRPSEHLEKWLWKRFKSSGGLGVSPASKVREQDAGSGYFQRLIRPAVPLSAAYIGAQGQAVCFGHATGIAVPRKGAAFRSLYSGSIAHRHLQMPGLEETLQQVGNWVASEFPLTGFFGIDFVFEPPRLMLLEVNPRYCASFELFERGWSLPLMQWHYHACMDGTLPEMPPTANEWPLHAKAIMYAPTDCRTGEEFESLVAGWSEGPWPLIADIPAPGTTFRPGDPVVTVFASAGTIEEVQSLLQQRREQVLRTLEST